MNVGLAAAMSTPLRAPRALIGYLDAFILLKYSLIAHKQPTASGYSPSILVQRWSMLRSCPIHR